MTWVPGPAEKILAGNFSGPDGFGWNARLVSGGEQELPLFWKCPRGERSDRGPHIAARRGRHRHAMRALPLDQHGFQMSLPKKLQDAKQFGGHGSA